MLQRLLFASVVAGALALGGCGKTITLAVPDAPGIPVSPLVPADNPFVPAPAPAPVQVTDQVKDVIAQVQNDLKVGCGWVVKTQSLLNIVSSFGVPYAGMASEIGGLVCDALTKSSARRGGGRPSVVVKGKRITIDAKRA
jgi:hypothetical protein